MKVIKLDDPYFEAVKEFPPQLIRDLPAMVAAVGVLKKLHALPRSELTYGQHVYIGLVESLVEDYHQLNTAIYTNAGRPDAEVLLFMMVLRGYCSDGTDGTMQLAVDSGFDRLRLQSVLRAEVDLSRHEVHVLAMVLKCNRNLFR